MGWKAAGGPQGGSSLLRKFWSRESAGFPARQGAGEGRCRGQAKRGRAAASGKAMRNGELAVCWDWDFCRGWGARRALRLRRSRRLCRRSRPQDGLPFGRPGRAEIQRKCVVTSALGPADGRRLRGFAAPARGKCGRGGWLRHNPPGVRQIRDHPRRQSAPARPR